MSTFTVLLSKAFLLLVVDTAGTGLLATTDHLHPEANMLTLLPADGLSLPDQIQHILEVAGTSNYFLCAPSKWETAFQISFSSSQKEKFIYSPNACMKFQIGQSEEKAASELESQGSLPPSWPLHGHHNWTFFFFWKIWWINYWCVCGCVSHECSQWPRLHTLHTKVSPLLRYLTLNTHIHALVPPLYLLYADFHHLLGDQS